MLIFRCVWDGESTTQTYSAVVKANASEEKETPPLQCPYFSQAFPSEKLAVKRRKSLPVVFDAFH